MNKYQVGQFGMAHIIIESRGVKRGISCAGHIQMIEKKYILFKDNDDFLYLVEKNNFEFKEIV